MRALPPTPPVPPRPIDIDEPNRLVATHVYLVQHVVNSLASRYPRHVDRGELWSAGAYGLVDASRRYDPAAGIPFTYAAIRIRGAIIDSTRTRDWAPRALRRDIRTVRQLGERFESAHGREATSEELASLLGVSVERLEEHRAAAEAATLLQLDHVNATGDGEACFGERIEEHDAAFLPEEAVEQRELIGTLRTAVQHLDGVQRQVVERYFFDGELLRDIAETLGVTEARVSQIRGEALNAMRAYFGTSYDGVPPVSAGAPGLRRRAAYVATMAAESTWRSRFEAGTPVGSPQGVARSA